MARLFAAAIVVTTADELASCTGATDPAVTEAQCYHGSGGALGLTESVDVKITDFANGQGHINVAGDGIESFTCEQKPFSKSGQDITTDLSDCQPSGIEIPAIKYCSDQDTVKVTVKDKAVPLPISAQLKRVDCASAEALASCSGSDDPDVSSPRCYHGSGGALGLTENVDVKISDYTAGAGHIDVKGDGIAAFTCTNKDFSKSGQDISTDLTDCQPDHIDISAIKYCSDQDTIKVTVKDDTVPLPVSATLKKVECSASTTAVDCTTAACPDQCQCGLDKCGDAINSCLADSACAASQECALACACSDTACTLKCAASSPSAKALPVATCLNSNCASTVAAVDCSTAACPDQCQCGLDKCGDAINSCLADSTCAASQECALACACSDTACTLKCAASSPSAKALPVASCLNSNCASVVV